MAFQKRINVNDGSGRVFEENTVAELQFDVKPEVGSFNAVTSDAVARAVAGASGEVPEVTESDNGKVLKAVYDEGGPAVEWGEAQGVTVDQTYDSTSTNAQSGVAVAGAIAGVNAVPTSTAADENKVLTVNASGNATWATPATPTVDQTYNSASTNAQSGTAVAQAIAAIPVATYTAGAGIDITDGEVSVKVGAGLEISDKWGTSEACGTGPGDESIVLPAALTMELLQNIVSGSGTSLLVGDSGMTWGPNGSGYHWFTLEIYVSWGGATRGTLSTFAYKEEGTQVIGPVEIDWANASSTSSVSSILAAMTSSDFVLLSEKYGDGTTPSGRYGVVVGSDTYTVKVASPTANELGVTNPVPNYTTSEDGKVLGVVDNSGTAELQWVAQQNFLAGDGIDITGGEVSAKVGAGLVIADHSTTTTVTETLSAPHIYESDPVTCICLASEIADALRSGTIDFTTTIAFQNARNDVIHVCPCICKWDGNDLHIPYPPQYSDNGGIVFNSEISLSGSAGNWVIPANTAIHVDTSSSIYYNTTVQYILEHIDEYCLCLICLDSNYEQFWGDEGYMQAPSSAAPGSTVPTATMTTTSTVTVTDALNVAEPVPSTAGVPNSSVLAMGNSGMEWVEGGVPSYMNITTGTVSIARDNTVVTSTADMTSIVVGADVKSAIVQWVVNSTTTLPTVTDGTNALKAAVNNPSSLTVGRTVQVSILNGTWVCAEFA